MWVGITAGGGIFRSACTPRLYQNIVLKTVIDEIDADVCSDGVTCPVSVTGPRGITRKR